MTGPRHDHDCNHCIFLGQFDHDGPLSDGTTEHLECDLYWCPEQILGGSLIARHSSEGPEYTSSPVDLVIAHEKWMIEQPSTTSAGLIEALRRYRMKTLHLVPAYGRDYTSRREIEGSLVGELDFIINDMSNQYDGKPINLPQIKEAGYTHLNVRYKKKTKVCVVEVAKLALSTETPKKEPGWYVQIVETATSKIEKEMGPMTERRAQKVESGASINLNHEKFHTNLVEVT
jgi:hypothetical protein